MFFRDWLDAFRVHQYVKNVLVFVPLLTAHVYAARFLIKSFLAFAAFSICASAAYLINDLADLESDRQHPTKRRRPFASGAIPPIQGKIAAALLLVVALAIGGAISLPFLGVLVAYFALTLAYSLHLKRQLMIDVVVLAALFTMRVVAGAIALSVTPSEWLLAFSMFAFTCLALVKRYVELALRIDNKLPEALDRSYRAVDLPVVGAMAAASGVSSVMILALYISSPAVLALYRHPKLLWLICPILVYWFGRVLLLAHRRMIDDDPILFAISDRASYLCGALTVGIVLLASY